MANVSDTFLKIRIWAKIILLALLVLYALLFLFKNSQPVSLWLFFGFEIQSINVILALLGAFLLGSLTTIAVRMVFKTVTQVRNSRDRGRTERLEREIADMRTKAATLQTRK